jgi:hypothetical protein
VFKNLAVLEPAFLDFNRREFFERIDEVSDHEIEGFLCNALTEPWRDVLDFANLDTFNTTLDPKWAPAYFRLHPGSPGDERDYVLSKLYQFIVAARSCSRYAFDGPDVGLETALEGLPSDIVFNAHSKFDVVGLVRLLRSDVRLTNTKILNSAGLGMRRARPNTPQRAGRTPPNKALAKKRKELWDKFEKAGGTTKILIQRTRKDRSQVSHYRTGRLPNTSVVTHAIEAEIGKFVGEADRHQH